MSAARVYSAHPSRVCRVCLASDIKLLDIFSHQLSQIFGELTGIAVSASDGFPQHMCTYCSSLLFKYAAFRDRCWMAQAYLQDARLSHHSISGYPRNIDRKHIKLPLTIRDTQTIDLTPDDLKPNNSVTEDTKDNIHLTVDDDNVLDNLTLKELKDNHCCSTNVNCNDPFACDTTVSIEKFDEDDDSNKFDDNAVDIPDGIDNESNVIESDVFKKDKKKVYVDTPNAKKKESKKVKSTKKAKSETKKIKIDSKKRKRTPLKRVAKKVKVDTEIPKDNIESDFEEECKTTKRNTNKSEKVKRPRRKQNDKGEKTDGRYKFNNEEQLASFSKQYNVNIVFLTEEEQRKEIEIRKETANYKNSEFKCNLCYKGYLVEATFKNHMLVHNPSSGDHACEICQFRFTTRHNYLSHLYKSHKMNLICKDCGNISKTPCKAKEHYKWHSGVKLECQHCGKHSDNRSSHLSHVRIFHGTTPCAICGEAFIGQGGLRLHIQRVHRETLKSRCPSCDIQFHSMDAFNRHLNNSPNHICQPNVRPCAECGDIFPNEDLVKIHVEQCHKKDVTCERCNKVFRNEKLYRTHLFRDHHIGVGRPEGSRNTPGAVKRIRKKTHMCEMCGASFVNQAVLRRHQRVHTGEKPHQCPMCPKSFRVKVQLQDHLNTHTGERPFKCAHCPKAFKSYNARHRHRLVHTQERRHQCHLCEKLFRTSTDLKTHVNTVHMKVFMPYQVRRKRNKD